MVEGGDLGSEQPLELPLMEDQQMVQAFLPHAPYRTLADSIGSWHASRRFEKLDATGRCHPEKTGSKLAVVITEQILGCLPIRRRFPELLRRPGIGRRASDADLDHLP